MLQQSVLSFQIPVAPTQADRIWLTLLHVIAVIASLYNSLPIAIRLILVTVIIASWIITVKRNKTDPRNYVEIELRNENQWSLKEKKGRKHSARILPSTVNTPLVVFLHLDLGAKGKRYLMIRRGMLDAEIFRQLRVALKISATKQSLK